MSAAAKGASDHTIKLDKADFGTVTVHAVTQPAGYLTLVPGFSVAAWRKPNWLHRTAMRVCFGWTWAGSTSKGATP